MTRGPRSKFSIWFVRAATFVLAPIAIAAASLFLAAPPTPDVRLAAHPSRFVLPAVPSALPPASSAGATPAERADVHLDRSGSSPVGRGVLFVPSSFHSADGLFDLLVFFHGNTELVAQSVAAAGLNALVLVVNVGTGSGAYEAHYGAAALFPHELRRVAEIASARGLVDARLGRLALGAWSAGYGAVLRLLEQEARRSKEPGATNAKNVSAVLLADALHSNLKDPYARDVDLERIAPFVQFAREAAAGDKLFVMTHSEVNEFRYATTTEAANALIHVVGAYRERSTDWPERPVFPLARQVMAQTSWLEQRSEAHKGQFHVRGYRGEREDDHIAHLAQISETLLADLVMYWSAPKKKRRR